MKGCYLEGNTASPKTMIFCISQPHTRERVLFSQNQCRLSGSAFPLTVRKLGIVGVCVGQYGLALKTLHVLKVVIIFFTCICVSVPKIHS